MDPREILFSHLPFSADAKVVYDLVKPFGPIDTMQARIVDRCLRVTFRSAESARRAVAALHGTSLFNTRISVALLSKDPVWAGFLCKTRSEKCLVDVVPVKGDCERPLSHVHQLRVTHRARLDDVSKCTPFAVGMITAGDTSGGVQRFIEYLHCKDRAGYVQLRSFCVYLVPKGPVAAAFGVDIAGDQLLAVFVRTK